MKKQKFRRGKKQSAGFIDVMEVSMPDGTKKEVPIIVYPDGWSELI